MGLRSTLENLLRPGAADNPALQRLVDDYARYHLVLAVMAGLFAVAFAGLALFSLRQFRRDRREQPRSKFRTRTHLGFATVSVVSALALAVITAANLSNAGQPRVGLAGSLGLIGNPAAGTSRARLHDEFNRWLLSGRARVPAVVQQKVDDRLAWQRPKAIVCGILLVLAVAGSVAVWRKMLGRTGDETAAPRARQTLTLVAGVVGVAASFVLMLMVMGNTQASFAPLAMTMFYG